MAPSTQDHLWDPSETLGLFNRAETTQSSPSASPTGAASSDNRPPNDKIIGISLAVASGLFIGSSFVLKKRGLLNANEKYHEEAGEGYGYLKNAFWWTGMTLMIIGELCNFVAYAFTDAIIVTPMGALSVVICAILSAIFLKERLSFVGKVACLICILGSVIIPLNAPERAAVKDIQEMQHYVIAPGFLSYAGVIILGCIFTAFWAGPRYGKKSMLVYLTICSLIGGLSVVATQGLGSAIIAQTRGEQQFNQWFLYVLFFFVIGTLLTEIIYLNKALNIFNAAMVTPTYYVYFTSATIVTSAILFQGLGGTPVQIVTIVLGFLTICSGVILLQMSSSAKDVPDAAIFSGDLNQMRTIAEQEQPESEPKADTLRGTAGLLRSISKSRRRMEHDEAQRIIEDKKRDHLESISEHEIIEWDGLRRRKTVLGPERHPTVHRQSTHRSVHPPLGMSRFPDPHDDDETRPTSSSEGSTFGFGFRRKSRRTAASQHGIAQELGNQTFRLREQDTDPSEISSQDAHVYGLPSGLRPLDQHDGSTEIDRKPLYWAAEVEGEQTQSKSYRQPDTAPTSPILDRRTFSFQNVLQKSRGNHSATKNPSSRQSSRSFAANMAKDATEEERLGLVKGASHPQEIEHDDKSDESDEDNVHTGFEFGLEDIHGKEEKKPYPAQSPQHILPNERMLGSTFRANWDRPLPSTPEISETNDSQGNISQINKQYEMRYKRTGERNERNDHFI